MNRFEFRKIIQVGCREAAGPDGVVRWLATFAFWLPAKTPRRCAGESHVTGVLPFEREALAAGLITEWCHEFEFPFQPTTDQLRAGLLPIWEALVSHELGMPPLHAPVDRSERVALEFSPTKIG